MLKKLLIANRGEIALRIINTAKRLGIETFAIYSDIDANAQHVIRADHAFCIGSAPSQHSYLNQEKILALCQQHEITAIHPGYGFLSENAEFCQRCEKAGIIFIGPTSDAIAAMGNKSKAKQIMQEAKVPTTPGYEGDNQQEEFLTQQAQQIGFPLLIKAQAGGGGKGMRLVNQTSEFSQALHSATSEAKSSFNDERVLLEKFISPARHVEVQVFADAHGNCIYLFDRDCSIQRRHQKIIEEAPAPNLSNELRQRMGETAVLAAKAIDYKGAGTVEFLLDQDNNFYFMEMNTRLQVEHPVTEMITNTDLVEWQLLVATGKPLPLLQHQLKPKGCAIEARISAEDPTKNFMPATGTLDLLQFPTASDHIRIDSGVIQGDTISPYYDPMIAKLIVWAPTRSQAVTKLKEALEQTYIVGVKSNVAFIHSILTIPDFQTPTLHTEFIEHHSQQLFQQPTQLPKALFAAFTHATFKQHHQQAIRASTQSADPHSPWFLRDNWRLTSTNMHALKFWCQDRPFTLQVTCKPEHITITYDNQTITSSGQWHNEQYLEFEVDGEHHHSACHFHSQTLTIFLNGNQFDLVSLNPNQSTQQDTSEHPQFIAPMPSTVVDIFVEDGQSVKSGDKLIVIEAMKMQHTITAPSNGIVEKVHFKKGDLLAEGDTLLVFKEAP